MKLSDYIAGAKSNAADARAAAIRAIGQFGKDAKPAVKALIEAGNDRVGDWVSVPLREMRQAMAWALGEIGPDAKEALPALKEWGKFYLVRWYTVPAIAKIEGKPDPATWR